MNGGGMSSAVLMSGASVPISNLTITGRSARTGGCLREHLGDVATGVGSTPDGGGPFASTGTVTLDNSTVTNNQAICVAGAPGTATAAGGNGGDTIRT
jgi:hypothetical protein